MSLISSAEKSTVEETKQVKDNSSYFFFQILLKTEGQIQQPKLLRSAMMIYSQIYMRSSRYAPTIPATSCECERSASSLRRLHTYNRACMGQERLSSLALINIHYQVKIDFDEVVNLFASKHPWRLELNTIRRD